MNNKVFHLSKGIYNSYSESSIRTFIDFNKSYGIIINSNQFSCSCVGFINDSKICKHIFGCFFLILEELKVPIDNYIIKDPFELINLIYNIKSENNYERLIQGLEKKFIFCRLTFNHKEIIKSNLIEDFDKGDLKKKKLILKKNLEYLKKNTNIGDMGNKEFQTLRLLNINQIIYNFEEDLVNLKFNYKDKAQLKDINQKNRIYVINFINQLIIYLQIKLVELSEDFGNKFDYSFIKIVRHNSEYEFFDKKDNQIFLNHINQVFCLIIILERIVFNEPNQEILLDHDEEELLNSRSKEEEFILKSRKKIRLPRKDNSYLILIN